MTPVPTTATLEMGKDGMVCKLAADGASMDQLSERCEVMNKLLSAGAPMLLMMGGMPMLMCLRSK